MARATDDLLQLVADTLGIPIDSIEIVHGDTDKIPYGMGTYGSRSLAVGGSAIVKAMDKVIAKGRKIAAHLLEAAEADVEFRTASSPLPVPTDRRVWPRWR
jgi:carbon-monoxide dehydrogenase large subunit